MAHAQTGVLARADGNAPAEALRQPSDQVLLEQFVTRSDETAFAGLVERYGKMVWGVCRRLLRQEQDVEDAFQAVFIILARKAAAIRKGEAVGSWLYGVAYRTAMRARRTAARRQKHEIQAVRPDETGGEPWANEAFQELQRLLDEELQRLGNKYRAPFVLCCLEGMSRAEAARELRLKEGTLSGLLARARKLLEKRLARRGVVLSAVLTAAALAAQSPAAAAPSVLVRAATSGALAARKTAAATVPTAALALARAVMRSMATARFRTALALVATMSLLIVGATLAALQFAGEGDVLDPDIFMPAPRALGTAVDEQVLTLAFSPDGTRLVTAGGRHVLPGQLQIWDAGSVKNLVTVRGIPGVRSVAFAPDGKTFVTGDFSGHVKLRDAISAEERTAVKGHAIGVNSVAFAPDGKSLVSAGLDHLLKLWSVPELQERRVLRGHEDMVFATAFFHKAPAVVSGSQDKTAIIWDVNSGAQKLVLKGHTAAVEAVAVAPDDSLVATASWDRTIKLWDPASGAEKAVLDERDAVPYSLSFSPDGKLLASARSDGQVRLWDLETRQASDDVRTHAAAAWAVAFSHDGRLLASGSSDRTAKVWHVRLGKDTTVRPVKTLVTTSPMVRPILALAYAPDGTVVAMAAKEGPIQIRDARTGDVLRVLPGHAGDVNCLAFSGDGRILASGSADATVKLWDLDTGKERKTLSGHAGAVNALAFTPDGARIATGGQDKEIRVWDTESGKQLDVFKGHAGPVRALAVTRDGRSLVSGSDDTTIKVWDVTRAQEPVTLKGHLGGVRALVLAGETVISGSDDGTVKTWDLVQGRWRLNLFGHPGGVSALALTPAGRTLVSCGQDTLLRVWDPASGELRGALPGHNAAVSTLAMHPRGKDLLSGGDDTMLLRWQGTRLAPAVPAPAPPAKAAPPPPVAAPQGQVAEAPPPAEPLRTEYPHTFYRDFRSEQFPLPPVGVFGQDANVFTHPEAKGLRVTLPAQRNGKDPVGLICRAPVDGDFEITAGYEIIQADRPKTGAGVGFELYLMTSTPGQDALAMMRIAHTQAGDIHACGYNFTRNGRRRYLGKFVPADKRTGRLRIVRNGTAATFLAADGDADDFRELHRYTFVPGRLGMVRLAAYTGQANEPVDVRIIDLKVRAESMAEELLPAEIDEDAHGWLLAALIVALVALLLVGIVFYKRRRQRGSAEDTAEQSSGVVVCTGCGKRLKTRPELAGRKVKCPQCRASVQVPASDNGTPDTHIVEDRRQPP